MAELDSATDPPYDRAGSGQEFSEIWARQLQVSCSSCILKLRDYPFSLISFRQLTIKGQLINACLKAPELFLRRRCIFLPLSHNRRSFAPVDLPDGSSVPNKFFVDIRVDSVGFELNYGQCQRGVIAAFSKAVAKLTASGGSTSTSPSLAWWDQLRYKIHGRLLFAGKLFSCRVLTSPNPYADEAMLVLTESFSIDSTKGKFSLSARHFQVNLDEGVTSITMLSRPGLLIACPYVRISLLFNWGCRRCDPSQHYVHHVQWQSHDYELSSIRARDLYDDFRARSLSMKLKIHCLAVESGHNTTQVIGPLVSFWFDNVPWLKQVYTLYVHPPNVCTITPKIWIGPNRAYLPVKSSKSFSALITQIKLQITFASTVFELIAEPEKSQPVTANNDNPVLGIQGFTQLLRFGADLDVISEHTISVSEVSTRKKWVWSKQRARSLHSSIDLLLPILSTSTDTLDDIKERLAHPLSQTPFATGEGDSGSMFFMSADNLSYYSPSAGGKLAVADLVDFTDTLLNVQLSPSSKRDPQSFVPSFSEQSLSPEEASVQQFLQSHFGDFIIRPFDEDSKVQALSFAAFSDAEIEADFENDIGPLEDDDNNREHYILVSGIRVLWNNSIRASFNAWWSFLSSFGHSQSSTSVLSDPSHAGHTTPEQQPRGIKHYATWSGTPDQFRRMSRPDNTPRRLTSSELFQRLDERSTQLTDAEDVLIGRESATPSIVTDDDGTASSKSHDDVSKMPESAHTRFAMRLEQPQVILQSVEVGCSVVISAHQAKVDVIAYAYYFPEDLTPAKSASVQTRSPIKPVLERSSSSYFSNGNRQASISGRPGKQNFMYFKKTIRSRLDQAQLHVVPNNIDVDSNAMEWIPLEDFPAAKAAGQSLGQEKDFVFDETASSADHLYQTRYLKSNGVFQRISQPTSLGFDYSYDVNMDTKEPDALEYQFLHRSTALESLQHDNDVDDHDSVSMQPLDIVDFTLPMLTSSSRLHISKINFVMDSLQCKVLISVIDKLVLSPVQHVLATARSLQAARRATTESVNLDPKELQKSSAEALGVQQSQPESNVFRRCISYEILGATWTLITKSPDVFLHVQLRRLHGSHRYRIGEGRDIELGLKEFRVRNLATNALWPDVIAPHHRWDVAKGSSELMLRVRALVLGWPTQYTQRLRDVTAWDHFDIKVFPLILKVQARHYSCTRDYFFPSTEPAPTPSTSQLLSQSHVVVNSSSSDSSAPLHLPYTNRQRRAAMTIRKPVMATNRPPEMSSILEPTTATAIEPVQIISYNYFKYFHISDLEFHIYFRGSFIDLDDLHVVITAFCCNGELWTWDKLLSKIETHVQTSVLKQSKSLIKQKFSSSVKSLAEKEHKIRDRFTAKFGRKQKDDESTDTLK